MNREYHKWYSNALGRDMEMLIFGHAGLPLLVFPTTRGRFFEYEDGGMTAAIAGQIDNGQVQLFCVDSVDAESWYNRGTHPRYRVQRHLQYERYIIDDVLPLIRQRNGQWGRLLTTGCSFGGFHAVNFAFRHPDLFAGAVSMGGAFDIHDFLGGYWDDDCYFNNAPDYLAGMSDPWYLDRYRNMRIVLAAGEWDICLDANLKLSGVLRGLGVPHWLDIWGNHTKHDWPYWRDMARKYF